MYDETEGDVDVEECMKVTSLFYRIITLKFVVLYEY